MSCKKWISETGKVSEDEFKSLQTLVSVDLFRFIILEKPEKSFYFFVEMYYGGLGIKLATLLKSIKMVRRIHVFEDYANLSKNDKRWIEEIWEFLRKMK